MSAGLAYGIIFGWMLIIVLVCLILERIEEKNDSR